MTGTPDFADAHRRHWKDAEFLLNHERLGNADQLYGFSAECGLKAVMRALKKPLIRKHVQELWPEFKRQASGRNGGRFRRQLPQGDPFAGWSTDDRYTHSSYARKEVVKQHRRAAHGIWRMIHGAELDGTL